jgi:sulfatase modifying factor 1
MTTVSNLSFVCLSWALCSNVMGQTEATSGKEGEAITNSIGMKLVFIPDGEFRMGSEESLADLERAFGELPDNFKPEMLAAEHPVHQVKVTKPFYLGAFEVTKREFRRFVDADQYKSEAERDGQGCPGWNAADKKLDWKNDFTWRDWGAEQDDDHPVVNVSWNDARAFCQWLSDREGKTYRLPTEAEWEYACRAGTRTRFYNSDAPEELVKIGNVPDAALLVKIPGCRGTLKASDDYAFTAPVGRFKANAFGVFDMAGNASEWCLDAYATDYYAGSPAEDPPGPSFAGFRVVRGGGWNYFPLDCRSARRIAIQPEYRNPNIGFRVILECEPPTAVAQEPAGEPRAGDTFTNSLGMKLALIPPGEFEMGSDENSEELEEAFEITDPDEALMEALAGFPEFGRPKDYAAEHPVHPVRISKAFYLGVYEVTKRQFRRFVAAAEYQTDAEKDGKGGWLWVQEAETLVQKPEYTWRTWESEGGDDHPVVNVSWNDAVAFCDWLSAKEGKRYRLPTEAEWEHACRAGAATRFYNGDNPAAATKIGNVRGFRLDVAPPKANVNIPHTHLTPKPRDGYVLTSPVGQFRRNRFGLFDMTGNVSEWCADWFDGDYYAHRPAQDPTGPAEGAARVIRGGGWDSAPVRSRSAFRTSAAPGDRYGSIGFRIALETDLQPRPLAAPLALAGDQAAREQTPASEPVVNTLGMKLSRIPAGEFVMGGDESLAELSEAFVMPDFFVQRWFAAERPTHPVRITRPFLMGVYEVTNGEFGKFAEATGYKTEAELDGKGGFGLKGKGIAQSPDFTWRSWGLDRGDDCPVVNVTWNDAVAFCKWLSEREGKKYRLPTEAEWEYACRADTETRFYNGDDPQALVTIGNVPDATFKKAFSSTNFSVDAKDGYVLTAPVGRFRPNRFGLYDMTGNVSEWCSDWCDTDYYASSPKADPTGPAAGSSRVIRGGSWLYFPVLCRSSARISDEPGFRRLYTGFRIVCEE